MPIACPNCSTQVNTNPWCYEGGPCPAVGCGGRLVEVQFRQSLCIASKPTWAAVSNSKRYGYGVWSWHDNKEDADFNASLLGTKAVPVDYHEGELIIPYLAQAVVKKEGFA